MDHPQKEAREDYTGRTVIVTGSTSGMWVEAIFKFAKWVLPKSSSRHKIRKKAKQPRPLWKLAWVEEISWEYGTRT
jgi:hypothetical protein